MTAAQLPPQLQADNTGLSEPDPTPGSGGLDLLSDCAATSVWTTATPRSEPAASTCSKDSHITVAASNKNSKSHIRCFNCHSVGHISQNCPRLKMLICYNCHSEGHKSYQCNLEKRCHICKESTHLAKTCSAVTAGGVPLRNSQKPSKSSNGGSDPAASEDTSTTVAKGNCRPTQSNDKNSITPRKQGRNVSLLPPSLQEDDQMAQSFSTRISNSRESRLDSPAVQPASGFGMVESSTCLPSPHASGVADLPADTGSRVMPTLDCRKNSSNGVVAAGGGAAVPSCNCPYDSNSVGATTSLLDPEIESFKPTDALSGPPTNGSSSEDSSSRENVCTYDRTLIGGVRFSSGGAPSALSSMGDNLAIRRRRNTISRSSGFPTCTLVDESNTLLPTALPELPWTGIYEENVWIREILQSLTGSTPGAGVSSSFSPRRSPSPGEYTWSSERQSAPPYSFSHGLFESAPPLCGPSSLQPSSSDDDDEEEEEEDDARLPFKPSTTGTHLEIHRADGAVATTDQFSEATRCESCRLGDEILQWLRSRCHSRGCGRVCQPSRRTSNTAGQQLSKKQRNQGCSPPTPPKLDPPSRVPQYTAASQPECPSWWWEAGATGSTCDSDTGGFSGNNINCNNNDKIDSRGTISNNNIISNRNQGGHCNTTPMREHDTTTSPTTSQKNVNYRSYGFSSPANGSPRHTAPSAITASYENLDSCSLGVRSRHIHPPGHNKCIDSLKSATTKTKATTLSALPDAAAHAALPSISWCEDGKDSTEIVAATRFQSKGSPSEWRARSSAAESEIRRRTLLGAGWNGGSRTGSSNNNGSSWDIIRASACGGDAASSGVPAAPWSCATMPFMDPNVVGVSTAPDLNMMMTWTTTLKMVNMLKSLHPGTPSSTLMEPAVPGSTAYSAAPGSTVYSGAPNSTVYSAAPGFPIFPSRSSHDGFRLMQLGAQHPAAGSSLSDDSTLTSRPESTSRGPRFGAEWSARNWITGALSSAELQQQQQQQLRRADCALQAVRSRPGSKSGAKVRSLRHRP